MRNAKHIFCGNRFNVLEEMLNMGLRVGKVLAVADSYLESEMKNRGFDYIPVHYKQELLNELRRTDFDYFISNGCPFILPESILQLPNKKFVNIHPSFLPDLRGADPVPGALLYGRDSGATCHLINKKIDDGKIIAQVRIPNTSDLDSGLLYQMSFMAEKEVFIQAYNRNFTPCNENIRRKSDIYYTYNDSDRLIDFTKQEKDIVNIIKAFSTKSKGAYFKFGGQRFTVFDVIEVKNPYLMGKIDSYAENEVALNYEGKLLIRKRTCFLKLQQIHGNLGKIKKGTILT